MEGGQGKTDQAPRISKSPYPRIRHSACELTTGCSSYIYTDEKFANWCISKYQSEQCTMVLSIALSSVNERLIES